jgi:hypothetical protein
MNKNLESETLRNLAKVVTPSRSINIYDQFIYDYKRKHFGEIVDNSIPGAANEWYNRRAEVFSRYVQRYFLRGRQ